MTEPLSPFARFVQEQACLSEVPDKVRAGHSAASLLEVRDGRVKDRRTSEAPSFLVVRLKGSFEHFPSAVNIDAIKEELGTILQHQGFEPLPVVRHKFKADERLWKVDWEDRTDTFEEHELTGQLMAEKHFQNSQGECLLYCAIPPADRAKLAGVMQEIDGLIGQRRADLGSGR